MSDDRNQYGGREGDEAVGDRASATGGRPAPVPVVTEVKGAPQHCSPEAARLAEKNRRHHVSNTCLASDDLREVARAYVRHFDSRPTSYDDDDTRDAVENTLQSVRQALEKNTSTDDELLSALHSAFGTKGRGEEYLWIHGKLSFLRQQNPALLKRLSARFRPFAPDDWKQNPHEWLSNFDIQTVMEQYERTVPDFAFVGVFPMDFEAVPAGSRSCVAEEMCRFDARALWRAGKRHVGVIFNTDKHDQSGSHWVSCYIGLDPALANYGVCYYDSVAMPATPEVRAFADRVIRQLRDLHVSFAGGRRRNRGGRRNNSGSSVVEKVAPFEEKEPALLENRVRKQFQRTECGVYAMFFVLCCMHGGIPFQEICQSMGNDDEIHQLRSVFFSPPP